MLSYLGIATSIGQAIDLPVIVRSLAVSMGFLKEDQLPLGIDKDFLLSLDSDLSVQNYSCQMVDNYECAWWKGSEPRILRSAHKLDASSIDKCLETHEKQLMSGVGPASHRVEIQQRAGRIGTPGPQSKCPKCREYISILSDTIQVIADANNLASTMLNSAETQWNIDMRRASTFNLLHEAAVIKEMGVSSASSETRIVDDAKSVAEKAQQELKRLQALPPTSHKWTWGESLSTADVLALARSGSRPKNRLHSGYDLSLKDGSQDGEVSSDRSMPKTLPMLNAWESASQVHLPDNTFPALTYFEKNKNLIYNPLGKTKPSASPVVATASGTLPELSAENVHLHTELSYGQEKESPDSVSPVPIEDEWSSAGGVQDGTMAGVESEKLAGGLVDVLGRNVMPETSAGGIEDMWESASDDEGENGVDGPTETTKGQKGDGPTGTMMAETSAGGIEDMWESASDDEGGCVIKGGIDKTSAVDIEAIEDVWTSASEDDVSSPIGDFSSQPTANSNFQVSPSRITIDRLQASFPLSNAWPDLESINRHSQNPTDSVLETPAPDSFRRYGPEDFSNLQDHMFEEKVSDSSDEDYDE